MAPNREIQTSEGPTAVALRLLGPTIVSPIARKLFPRPRRWRISSSMIPSGWQYSTKRYDVCYKPPTANSYGQPSEVFFGGMTHHDLVVTGLIKPLTALASRLQTVSIGKIPLFFAFDEVSNLAADGRLALGRVVRLLRKLPVWAFALSTQPALEHVSPSVANDRSSRVTTGDLKRIPPSTHLHWMLKPAIV